MELLLAIGAAAFSFILVLITVPPILRVARAKHLFEAFEERKVHQQLVPPLGGVAIFIAFILSTIIATTNLDFQLLKYVIASVMLMFFIGLKDDLIAISPKKKLLIQVCAALILVVLGNVRFTNLHGIAGIYDIGYIVSIIISVFTIIVITNAFNLIDGVDGLASGLAIMSTMILGVWFFMTGQHQLAILSMALLGSLVGFFLYNVFGNSNKLFMGDTGSLIIGIIVSFLIIRFNELNVASTSPIAVNAAPVLSFVILIVPLVDTMRVMTIRILQHKSPFYPDRNHIHHRLLDLLKNHLNVTITLVSVNILLIGLALILNNLKLNINIQFIVILGVAIALSFAPSLLLKSQVSAKKITIRSAKQKKITMPEFISNTPYSLMKKRQSSLRNGSKKQNKPISREWSINNGLAMQRKERKKLKPKETYT